MLPLIIENYDSSISECFIDYDYQTFKDEYERNGARSLSLTINKTSYSSDIFNLFQNDNMLIWDSQYYVIKNTNVKYNGRQVTNEIQAEHIMFELQNHYVEKENTDDDAEDKSIKMSLKQYIDYGLKGNLLGYEYEIVGSFKEDMMIESLGEKNAMEHLTAGAEVFGYIFHADNKKIYIYDEDSFYKSSNVELRYKFNTIDMNCSINSNDVKNFIKVFGKKITTSESKKYNAIKTPDVTLKGKFIKTGTYRTETPKDYYSTTLNCKWGNETVEWTLKKMSKGGIVQVYFNGQDMGRFSCYSKNAKSETITLKKNVPSGQHTLKVVFIGPEKGVDYGKSKPCMYIGTEKSTVISSTAVFKNEEDKHHGYVIYKADNYNPKIPKQAPSIYSTNLKDEKDLMEKGKKELQSEPVVEMSTSYSGKEPLSYNDKIWFIHEPTGIEAELKIVKITKSHPYVNKPDEVEFSNTKTDIIDIQQKISNKVTQQSGITSPLRDDEVLYSDIVGVTLLDG